MKVITVKQPWAHLIIHGPKRIENRSWPTSYRGPLLIHAGKSAAPLSSMTISDLRLENYGADFDFKVLVYGAIIGVVHLTDCVSVEQLPEGEPFAEGPWCWILTDPRALTPFPCRGALSLWQPPPGFQM